MIRNTAIVPSILALSVAAAGQALAQSDTLTVYTYSSFNTDWGPGPQIASEFEAQCNCTVQYVSSEDGVTLLNRARLEGSNTNADVILGIDDALIAEARGLDLFQPHGIDWDNVPLDADLEWNDNLFVPFDYGYFAWIYNTEEITEPAGSFEELLSSDASVIYMDPRTSTVGQGLLHWVQAIYGDDADDAWADLADQTVTVTSGWSEGYNMFLSGEADYVLSYTTSPAYHQVAEDDHRYRAARFSEGHVAQIEVAGVSAYTDQPDLAKSFVEFLVASEAQQILPVTNWMLPTRTGVELPDAFDELARPERIGFEPQTFADNRDEWLRAWRNGVSR